MSEPYVLIKRDMFWRPNGQGYTGVRELAGRYFQRVEPLTFYPMLETYTPSYGHEDTYAIPLSEAPEFTNACCVHVQRDHLRAKLTNEALTHGQALDLLESAKASIDVLTKERDELKGVLREVSEVLTCAVNFNSEAEHFISESEYELNASLSEPSAEVFVRGPALIEKLKGLTA